MKKGVTGGSATGPSATGACPKSGGPVTFPQCFVDPGVTFLFPTHTPHIPSCQAGADSEDAAADAAEEDAAALAAEAAAEEVALAEAAAEAAAADAAALAAADAVEVGRADAPRPFGAHAASLSTLSRLRPTIRKRVVRCVGCA